MMQRLILLIFITGLSVGCVSVKKFNSKINEERSVANLKSDIDYTYRKLQKLHPDLYWYISKKELDFKFDSLKSIIITPMTSNDFYLKLSEVVSSVKQGHLKITQLNKKLKGKERSVVLRRGTSPLSQFDFESFNDNLYITRNNSADSSIKAGTELVAVDSIKPQVLISKYRKTFASDGFNKTFLKRKSAKAFPLFYYYQNGVKDSVLCQLRYSDTLWTQWLRRNPASKVSKYQTHLKLTDQQIKKLKEENRKRHELGYNRLSKTYSKNLSFFESDSSVALMKINDFSRGHYRKFYRESFRKMDSLKTRTLILDLRDNPGGRLSEVYRLYSYLVDSNYYFIEKAEVASKTSLLHINYFHLNPILALVMLPGYLGYSVKILLKVKRGEDGKYYYSWYASRAGHPKPENFKGKVYVMINGGSFSASCLLSSNLKSSGRACFVGEETGGAFNGTVAGVMPVFTLPKSKLNLRFGLALIRPRQKTDPDGRGIFPDMTINPTLDDRIKGNDPGLKWILEDIKGRQRLSEAESKKSD
jgi:hypothetical protein